MQASLPGLASAGARQAEGNVFGGCATVLNQLGLVLWPSKTLQQLLEYQACGEHQICPQKGVAEGDHLGCGLLNTTAQSQ